MSNNLNRSSNKVCLITGAARGIGFNIARAMGKEGFTLAISDVNEKMLSHAKERLVKDGFIVEVFTADLALTNEPASLVNKVVKKLDRLDVVINNARAGEGCSFESESEENWDLAFNVNLKAAFFLAKTAIEFMPKDGSIITISSVCASLISEESPSYHISKAGLSHLTRYLAVFVGKRGIRVNSVVPGFIVQDEHREKYSEGGAKQEKYRAATEALHPLRTGPGHSDDVANAVVFLTSKEAKFITGQEIVVDGGLSIQEQTKILFSYAL
jgi:NAD(P)-dependent dehydrogenase (short-subunit alcohol dehydrogenase family)